MSESLDISKIMAREKNQIEQKVTSELTPFLDGIRGLGAQSRQFQLFKENYNYFIKKYKEKSEVLSLVLSKEEISITDISGKIYLLFTYLGAIETLGNSMVNILVMTLVANGIDFHIESRFTTPRIKHTTSIKELEKGKVSLGTKLNFLKDNNIKSLSSIIDKKLRNDIDHLNFSINKNDLCIRTKPVVPMVLVGLSELFVLFGVVTNLLISLGRDSGLFLTNKNK